jgi:hypothetical protein
MIQVSILNFEALLRSLERSARLSDLHEEEEGDEHMPDRSDLLRVFAARLAASADVGVVAAAGGDIDWPLAPAVRAASEP